MIRPIICSIIAAVTLGAAPASRPSLSALHAQAFELMRQGDYAKARPVLEQVYNAVPPIQRNRALLLNHSILEIAQERFVMRGVKDLLDYLTKHRDEDELATNVLAGALNIAARDANVKRGDLWQAAFREWDRRNYLLDQSRKGFRRWGTRWLADEDYKQIKAQQDELKQAVTDQQEQVNRASLRAVSLIQQQHNAMDARDQYSNLYSYLQSYTTGPNAPWAQLMMQNPAVAMSDYYWQADASARRLSREATDAIKEYEVEAGRLVALRRKVIRPEWPTRFEPVDPQGPEADKPAKPVATTEPRGIKTPFGVLVPDEPPAGLAPATKP